MRLTLRTLIAWLDDTLPPAEVRVIGQQVAESEYARDLIERIKRVSRQRRLTVPSSTGSDPTDPNMVAAYLDNELPPDQVAEFEKRCLTSDVHLAEVASTHQILSLIGQKAKVPDEAKERMYRLIKGRETVKAPSNRPRRKGKLPPALDLGKEAAAASASPNDHAARPAVAWDSWDVHEPARRPVERFGPAILVTGLLLVLGWSTWKSLHPGEEGSDLALVSIPGLVIPDDRSPEQKAAEDALPAEPDPTPRPTDPDLGPEPDPETVAEEPAPAGMLETKPAPEPTAMASDPDLPPGAVGVVGAGDSLLFRRADGSTTWESIGPEAAIQERDRLVGVTRLRAPVRLGSADLALVGDSEIVALGHPPDQAARFDWVRGRVVVRGGGPEAPIGIGLGDAVLEVTPPEGAAIGLEPAVEGGGVLLTVPAGTATIDVAGTHKEVVGPASVRFEPPSGLANEAAARETAWITDDAVSPLDRQIGTQFGSHIRPGGRLMTGLLEALDDESREVRAMAIAALGSIGAVDLVVPALSTPDEPEVRRSAIGVLRAMMARGGDAAKLVHEELVQTFGADQALAAETLLRGYSAEEARRDETYAELVKLLTAGDLGLRELAIGNLRALTGRDDLGYNPDDPAGPGVRAWQELLRKKELRPAAPPAKP